MLYLLFLIRNIIYVSHSLAFIMPDFILKSETLIILYYQAPQKLLMVYNWAIKL